MSSFKCILLAIMWPLFALLMTTSISLRVELYCLFQRSFKGAYLDENKKRDEREQSQIGGGEESGSTAQLQVTRGEGSTSSKERANEDRENVDDGRKVVDEKGNIQQVTVPMVLSRALLQ